MREKGLLSGNFICKTRAISTKEFFGYSLKSKTIKGNSDSSDNKLGNFELPEIVEVNLEIQQLAFKFKINCLHDKSKANFKPVVDLLPLTTVKNTLQMKIKEIAIADDDGDEENTNDTDIDFSELLGYLGELCSDLIYQDIQTVCCLYQDDLYFSSMNMLEFIKSGNKNLLSFLLGASALDLNKLSKKSKYTLACMIESIYHLCNSNIVLPHSFLANLVQIYTSGSKAVHVINNKLTAGGSYFTVHSWMSKRAESPLLCPKGKYFMHESNTFGASVPLI